MGRKVSASLQRKVRKRANGCCEYCLAIESHAFHPFSIDHVIPLSKGGSQELSNLALACLHCNQTKYNKRTGIDPLNAEEVPLFHPRKDQWSAHFTWNAEKSAIIGLTPTGRATVHTMKLNRPAAVALRQALKAAGLHPPF